uniref:Rho GTPase-activating protein 44 n=1 Tax=Takifugu rubripes TaxID=31033 RepID=A0A674NFB6_TAKRU
MKKQFNRMRQLANQTVGRAEKTEVLSEDLLQVEKRLDLVKQVTHSTHKKLTACLQGQQGADTEKRSKKLPLTTLAQCLIEGAAVLGDDSLLGKMLKLCGETEERLAQELIQFEFQIERDVVEPLCLVAEVRLSGTSCTFTLQQSSKSSSHPSSLQPGTKSESLREEMEEAANRMEICRDQLSADMYSFVAKEIDYANYFQTLIETQAEYHRKSLEILHSILPQIKAHQEAWVEKPSFGKSLEEHLNISGREIAFPIEACVTMLLECGMQEEGLFRVAPSASKLKKLKASLDCGIVDVQEYSSDPHAIAGALKSYLRELPEPLMTLELYDEWIQASNVQDMDKRLQTLMSTCEKLPTDNLNNFRYLIKFLARLSDYQDANKMTPSNMAIVLGPSLLWTHTEPNMTEMMTTLSLQIVGIIEPIIQHADWFFPGEIEFNLTGSYGSPIHTNHNSNYIPMPSPDIDQSEHKQQHDQSRRPLSVATDNMMLEFYKKDGIRKIQSMGVRVMDTSWVSRKGSATLARKTSSTPPGMPGSGPGDALIPEQPGELGASPLGTPPPLFNGSPPYYLMADICLSCFSSLKSKELSPVTGHKAIQVAGPTVPPSSSPQSSSQSPHSTEHSPHTLHKGSKKLAPAPPKVPYSQSGGLSDQSTGQPSPVSLSPTPPSTPSPYGLVCPSGQMPPPSPGQTPLGTTHSLSSPPSLTGTLTKSRPAPKPRQRPSLPPPQPPTAPLGLSAPAPGPQPLEQGFLDGLSPGESMSTGKHQSVPMAPPPVQVGPQRPSLRLAVALSNGDGGRV